MSRVLVRAASVAFAIALIAFCTACARREPAAPAPAVSALLDGPPGPDRAEEARVAREATYRRHLDAGTRAFAGGEMDAAISHLKEALNAKPDGSEAAFLLGRAFVARKNDAEAIKAFAEAIRGNAEHVDAYMERAAIYTRTGKLNDASYDYRQVIAIDPSPKVTARAHWLRGEIMARFGKWADARYDRRRAMELDPEYRKLVIAGDICVHNHTEKKVTITFEKIVNPDGSARTFPTGSRFTIPDEQTVFLQDGDRPLTARMVRYTVATEIASNSFEQAYEKGVTLDIHINEDDLHKK